MTQNLIQGVTKPNASYYNGSLTPNKSEFDNFDPDTNMVKKVKGNLTQDKTINYYNHRGSYYRNANTATLTGPKTSGNTYSRVSKNPFVDSAREKGDNIEEQKLKMTANSRMFSDKRYNGEGAEIYKPYVKTSQIEQQQPYSFPEKYQRRLNHRDQSNYNQVYNRNNALTEKTESYLTEEPRPYIIKQDAHPEHYSKDEVHSSTAKCLQSTKESIKQNPYHANRREYETTTQYSTYTYKKLSDYLESRQQPVQLKQNADFEQKSDRLKHPYLPENNVGSIFQHHAYSNTNCKTNSSYSRSENKLNTRKIQENNKLYTAPVDYRASPISKFDAYEYGYDGGVLNYSKNVDSGALSTATNINNNKSAAQVSQSDSMSSPLTPTNSEQSIQITTKQETKLISNLNLYKQLTEADIDSINSPGATQVLRYSGPNPLARGNTSNEKSEIAPDSYSQSRTHNTQTTMSMRQQDQSSRVESEIKNSAIVDYSYRKDANHQKNILNPASTEEKAKVDNQSTFNQLKEPIRNQCVMNSNAPQFTLNSKSSLYDQLIQKISIPNNTNQESRFLDSQSEHTKHINNLQNNFNQEPNQTEVTKKKINQEQVFNPPNEYVAEVQTTIEDRDSKLNYGNISDQIRAIPLLSERTKKSYLQQPLIEKPSVSPKESTTEQESARADKKTKRSEDSGGCRESVRSEHLNALFEEYQNSGGRSKRSRSETGIRRPSATQGKKTSPFLTTIKEIPTSIVKSTKNYLVNKFSLSDARVKCSCSSDLGRNETCGQAMKWLMSRYKHSELEYLKNTYENLQVDAVIDIKSQKQIVLDVSRTFPSSRYFSSDGGGTAELQKVLECFAKFDPQIGMTSSL